MNKLALLLRVLVRAVLRAFLPAAFETARDAARTTCEDSRPQPELKARLQNRIRTTWGRAGAVGTLALCILMAAGCGVKVIYVPDGQPVRLRQNVKAKVWVMDADGNPRASRMTIPDGWFALPDKDDPQETIRSQPAPPVASPPDECPGDAPRVCYPFVFTSTLP